jgi:hypothetical protein
MRSQNFIGRLQSCQDYGYDCFQPIDGLIHRAQLRSYPRPRTGGDICLDVFQLETSRWSLSLAHCDDNEAATSGTKRLHYVSPIIASHRGI